MIFHDVNKAAKGVLKDFTPVPPTDSTDDAKKYVEKHLRLSPLVRIIQDFRGRQADQTNPPPPSTNSPLRLSPLTPRGTRRESGETQTRTTGTHTVLFTLLAALLCIVVLLGYSAWTAAGTEVSYARQGLSSIIHSAEQVRSLYATGHSAEAVTAFADLSQRMQDFAWNLRMRLLLPQGRSTVTETELPSATLDFVTSLLSAFQEYHGVYAHIASLTKSTTDDTSLDMLSAGFTRGTTNLVQARNILASIPTEGMPDTLKSDLTQANGILNEVANAASALQTEMPTLLDALGGRYPRRYAILLQNADEMRPTGGFIGGVLFVDLNEGRMRKAEYSDVYELDWRLPKLEPAPPDVAKVSPTYGLRDSNHFADFPRSAREALRFFEQQGIPTVDGVIAINHHLLERILSETGPIHASALPIDLTGQNVSQILSLIVESKRTPEKPKTIIKDLVPTLLERITSNPLPIARVMLDELRQGNIALYAVDLRMQETIERSGLAGTPRSPDEAQDYLMLTESNIGGNKSDRYVTEQVTHLTNIGPDGTRDTLHIVRQHGFTQDTANAIRSLAARLGIDPIPDTLMDIMGRGQNKTIVRVSVPLHSTLVDTAGIPSDIVTTTEDAGRTVFSFPMNVLPGNVVDATLTYSLPPEIRTDGKYTLLIDKQIGQKTVSYDKRLQFTGNVTIDGATTKEYGKRIDLDRSQTFTIEWE